MVCACIQAEEDEEDARALSQVGDIDALFWEVYSFWCAQLSLCDGGDEPDADG